MLLGAGATVALKLSVVFFSVVGTLAMYGLVLSESGRRDAAFLGAMAFVAMPYRFVCIFARGDLAETSAMALVPLAFWSYRTIGRAEGHRLALAGCAAAGPPTAAPSSAPLKGNWRIDSIDGRAPLSVREDADTQRTPRFGFGERSYGGTSGCNFMGGLKIERGSRLYTYPGPQTQMACLGPLGAQEAAIDVLFRSSPTIAWNGESVVLTGAGHTLRLVPEPGRPPVQDPPEAWQGTRLAGQSFELHQIDGDSLNRRPAPLLRFGERTATLTRLCPRPISGAYVQGPGSLRIVFNPSCPAAQRHFAGPLATASGPNGELLLAGEGHWLAGDNLRRDRPK
jgi:heat shock protein HslJ